MLGEKALFQPVGTEGYPSHIADRSTVYKALGLFSDWLNWNIHSDLEQRLREILCEIYGHQPYSGFTWKPADMCYWCHASVTPINARGSE